MTTLCDNPVNAYAHEKYEPGFLITGEDHGTPEEAFETSAHFL